MGSNWTGGGLAPALCPLPLRVRSSLVATSPRRGCLSPVQEAGSWSLSSDWKRAPRADSSQQRGHQQQKLQGGSQVPKAAGDRVPPSVPPSWPSASAAVPAAHSTLCSRDSSRPHAHARLPLEGDLPGRWLPCLLWACHHMLASPSGSLCPGAARAPRAGSGHSEGPVVPWGLSWRQGLTSCVCFLGQRWTASRAGLRGQSGPSVLSRAALGPSREAGPVMSPATPA